MSQRAESDEHYVIDIFDSVLRLTAKRGHRFSYLLGDPGRNGVKRPLPVDAYYGEHMLVVEYHERQHWMDIPIFNKEHKLTVSGVHRGEQRRRYDQRRAVELPEHNITLLIIRCDQFNLKKNRLVRDCEQDRVVLKKALLAANIMI